MISRSFIMGTESTINHKNHCLDLNNFIESCMNDVEEAYKEIVNAEMNYVVESSVNGESNELALYMEKQGEGFFTTVGNAIISAIKAFIEFIKGIIEKISNASFKAKSDLDKLAEVCKKNPDVKDDILLKWKEGELVVADARAIEDIEKSYTKLVELSKKSDTDPESFKGKVKAFIDNINIFNEEGKGTKAILTGAKVLTAVAGVIVIPKAINDAKSALSSMAKSAKSDKDDMENAYKVMSSVVKKGSDPTDVEEYGKKIDPENRSKYEIMKALADASGKKLSFFTTISGKTEASVSKLLSSVSTFVAGSKMDKLSNIVDKEVQKREDKTRKEARDYVANIKENLVYKEYDKQFNPKEKSKEKGH